MPLVTVAATLAPNDAYDPEVAPGVTITDAGGTVVLAPSATATSQTAEGGFEAFPFDIEFVAPTCDSGFAPVLQTVSVSGTAAGDTASPDNGTSIALFDTTGAQPQIPLTAATEGAIVAARGVGRGAGGTNYPATPPTGPLAATGGTSITTLGLLVVQFIGSDPGTGDTMGATTDLAVSLTFFCRLAPICVPANGCI